MITRAAVCAFAFAFANSSVVSEAAQELPPLPATLLNASGAVCIKVTKQNEAGGVYILASTGDPQVDRDMLAWVRELRWPVATSGEKLRDTWFPMPIAFGEKQPPKVAATCVAPE